MDVKIRPLQIEDAFVSVKWRNDPEVFKFTANTYTHEITIESEMNWIKRVIENENEYRCAILADGKYVGNIYLTDIDGSYANYHIFIGDKRYWGKGIARSASEIILEYAFVNLGLEKVFLNVDKRNRRAMDLYKRLGFKKISEQDRFVRMQCEHLVS